MAELRALRWRDYSGFFGEPSVIIRVLTRGRQEDQSERRCEDGNKVTQTFEHTTWPAFKMKEEAMSQRMQVANELEKVRKHILP